MATVVFAAVAAWAGSSLSAAGAAALTAAATAAGAYIDSTYTFPALFPPPDTKGPRLDSLGIQSAVNGGDGTHCVGPTCRVTGQVILCTDLIEVETDVDGGGGKGGSGGDFLEYVYYIHMAVAVALNPTSKIKEIWADGKKIYDETPDITYTDSSSAWTGVVSQSNVLAVPSHKYINYLTITVPIGGADFSQFVSGRQIVVSGFTSSWAGNNGTYLCKWARQNQDGSTTVRIQRGPNAAPTPFAAFVPANGQTPTLFMSHPAFSKKTVNDIRIYYGSRDQVPDSLITSLRGSSPAYRNITYIVFEKLWTFDFGNRPPNFTFIVEERPECSVAEAVSFCMGLADIPDTDYDVTDLEGLDFFGYAFRGIQDLNKVLEPIMIAYDVIASEKNGKLTFTQRKNVEVVAIDEIGLDSEGNSPRFHRLSDDYKVEPPSEIILTYQNNEGTYEEETVREKVAGAEKPNIADPVFALTMDQAMARAVAHRMLWASLSSRMDSFELPPKYLDRVREGVVVTFNDGEDDYRVLVEKVDRGANDLLMIEGTVEQEQLYV